MDLILSLVQSLLCSTNADFSDLASKFLMIYVSLKDAIILCLFIIFIDMGILERMLLDPNAKPRDLQLSLLKAITDNFSDAWRIGSGGFSAVYMVRVTQLSLDLFFRNQVYLILISSTFKRLYMLTRQLNVVTTGATSKWHGSRCEKAVPNA